MGRSKLVVATVIALAMTAHSQNSEHVWLPMKLFHGYLIVVEGTLGDLQNRHLLIDTAAYPSVIDAEIATKLHLTASPDTVQAMGKHVASAAAMIPAVKIGPVEVHGPRVGVEDLHVLSKKIGTRIDGLIGMDILGQRSFRIDYEQKQIIFGPVGTLAESAPLERVDSMDCVEMQIDGHQLRLLVGSAASGVTVFAQARAWGSGGKPHETTTVGGKVSLLEVHAGNLILGRINIGPANILVSSEERRVGLPFDGLFSTRALGFGQVAFDFEHHAFLWQRADHRVRAQAIMNTTAFGPLPPLDRQSPQGDSLNCNADVAGTPCAGAVMMPQR